MTNYCIVGAGSRGLSMFAEDLVGHYQDVARLTAIADINPGRVNHALQVLGSGVKGFTDFDEMLDTAPCDVVIVTTKDATHDEFIVKAMSRGKDVISEKPMTTDAAKCRSILAAERETGRNLRVTFNYRYAPYKTEVKRLLQEGIVGDVQSVEFRWFLDTVHGADYFRRWHSQKKNSGGLLVHKATHHFDLINWWLDLEPQEVVAMGARQYYLPSRMPGHGKRCSECHLTQSCEFYLDLDADPKLRALYRENEHFDQYYRDGCVFSEDIDIEDTMSVLIRYPKNIQVTYGLTAATAFEGWQVAFNGSLGRLEAFEPECFVAKTEARNFKERSRSSVRRAVDWRQATAEDAPDVQNLAVKFYPLFGGVKTFEVTHQSQGHGGGDRRLKDHLFRGVKEDPMGHAAGSRAGAMSILVGVAANQSMAERRLVRIEDLLNEHSENKSIQEAGL
ncbi:MAG: Gfo/Idh/MocA family oxidoreductase [Firmicutes bacterium]|nr:Gfo/Idh/MocA family oxidoreductase [Bacillota bacterium]